MNKLITLVFLTLSSFFTDTLLAKDNIGIRLGYPAPDITSIQLNGDTLKLSSLKGDYVVLDFWASWCRPCRNKSPYLVSLYNQFKDVKFDHQRHGFQMYSHSLDMNKAAWENAIQQDGLIWANHTSELKGWDDPFAWKFGVQFIPNLFLIDPEGNIVLINPSLETLISYLQEKLTSE